MRLIDADALKKFIDFGHLNNPNEKNYSENGIREMIDMMPTIDAVEVVRCGDCRHQHKCLRDVVIRTKGGVIHCPVEYCSCGERRTE